MSSRLSPAMDGVVDFPVKPEARAYVEAFARPPGEPEWLARHREQSLARFAELGFPSRRGEAWRYIDLAPLAAQPLFPAAPGPLGDVPPELGFGLAWARIVLADGNCQAVASRPLPQGVWLGSMRRAIVERPDLVRGALDGVSDAAAHPFAALNAALFADGFVLDIAPGAALDRPIEIVHFASQPGSSHTRNLINLGAGSRATVVETYAGKGRYWRNDVAAVRLAAEARLTRIVLVEESAEALHLAQTTVSLDARAHFEQFALLLDGRTVRHEANVEIAGEGASCTLNGAFVVSGRDEVNIVTAVDHLALGGTTRELFKGVGAGRGHGAFQGRIVVHPGAQKTDAHQLSRNLIIGNRAVIDTKPELEIYADEVKCAHGASVGDLDEAALFYLRSRGLPQDEARRLLIEGFLREAIERVDDPALREHLIARLARRLAALED